MINNNIHCDCETREQKYDTEGCSYLQPRCCLNLRMSPKIWLLVYTTSYNLENRLKSNVGNWIMKTTIDPRTERNVETIPTHTKRTPVCIPCWCTQHSEQLYRKLDNNVQERSHIDTTFPSQSRTLRNVRVYSMSKPCDLACVLQGHIRCWWSPSSVVLAINTTLCCFTSTRILHNHNMKQIKVVHKHLQLGKNKLHTTSPMRATVTSDQRTAHKEPQR